jgi:hypothetical protein
MIWLLSLSVPSEARLTDKEVTALVEEVLPLVEQAAGRRLEPRIPVEVVAPGRFAAMVGQEQGALATLTHPGLPAAQVRMVAYRGHVGAPAVIAKYALFEHAIYVSPESLEATVEAMQKDGQPVTEEGFARCVLAHELAHAFQAQTGAFERVAAAGDAEWLFALNMVAEGHAVQLHEQVCDEAHRGPTRKMLGLDGDLTPYGVGYAFLATQADPWAVFEAPPVDTAMVYLPERYAAAELPRFDRWEALEQAARALVRNTSTPVVRSRSGYHQLRAPAPTHEALRAALGGLESAHLVEAFPDLGQVSVLLARFRDEASAQAYVAAIRGLPVGPQSSQPTYLEPPVPVSVGEAEGFRAISTVRPSDGGTAVLRHDLWGLARGPWVVTVTLTNNKPKDKHILAALDQLQAGL